MRNSLWLALVLMVAGACGSDGDGDGDTEPIDGMLDGEAILEALLDVDGAESGLDCDTIDGVDSSQLASAGTRTVMFSPNALSFRNLDGAGSFNLGDDPAGSDFRFNIRLPQEIDDTQPIELYVLTQLYGGPAPCGVHLSVRAIEIRDGDGFDLTTELDGGEVQAYTSLSEQKELRVTLSNSADATIAPGAWLWVIATRTGNHANDTCTQGLGIWGAAIEYQAL
ncbi:MAG: hypothetical protein KJO07_03565 [Deltaproteobacteria bacterium]|nr:hypothetical protein [Deltaproteobacteria bacterium]